MQEAKFLYEREADFLSYDMTLETLASLSNRLRALNAETVADRNHFATASRDIDRALDTLRRDLAGFPYSQFGIGQRLYFLDVAERAEKVLAANA